MRDSAIQVLSDHINIKGSRIEIRISTESEEEALSTIDVIAKKLGKPYDHYEVSSLYFSGHYATVNNQQDSNLHVSVFY